MAAALLVYATHAGRIRVPRLSRNFLVHATCILIFAFGVVVPSLYAQSSVSGQITPASVSSGATVSLRNAQSRSTVARTVVASDGSFGFSGIANGSYVVRPYKRGVTFSPTSKSVQVSGSSLTGINFTAASSTTRYSISGTITGGAGATVTLGGASAASTTADSNGNYSFTGLANGTYTITPSGNGLSFSPAAQNVTINGANITGVNFSASSGTPTTYSISGTISPSASGAGATVTLGGASTATTTTDSNGNYTFTNLSNGNYTVAPSRSGYTFSPVSANVAVNGANVTGTNFTASATSTSTAPQMVQVNQNQVTTGSSVSSSLNKTVTQGNTLVVYVIWDNTSAVSVSDSLGSTFKPVSAPLQWSGSSSAQVFYASNVAGGTESVSATFGSAVSSYGIVYVHEYAGISSTNPVDVTISAMGTSSAMNSGTATTTNANDLLFGAGVSSGGVTATGPSFVARDSGYGNITEDSVASSPGAYSATATQSGSEWGMQMVAFRPIGNAGTWSISGTIAGGSGATIALTGAGSATTTADANGNYSFTNLPNGNYVVTPSESGYTFSPANASVTVNNGNVVGANFTATASAPTTWNISGTISPAANGAGATVTLTGTQSSTTTADSSGNFNFAGVPNGSYTVTPTKSGFSFSPPSANVVVNGANASGTNFTASTSTGGAHSVDLSWTASTSSSVSGYKIYRSTTSGGPYAVLNTAPVTSTVYTDLTVTAGTTYYYVVTAVDSAGNESTYSNEAAATIPTP